MPIQGTSYLIIISMTFYPRIIEPPHSVYYLKGNLITNKLTEFRFLITFTALVTAISLTRVTLTVIQKRSHTIYDPLNSYPSHNLT